MATDLLTAGQDAVFAALDGAGLQVPVFQHVPANQKPPYVLIGDLDADAGGGEDDGAKDGGLDVVTVEVATIWRGDGRRGLLALLHAQREAIEGQRLPAPGAYLGPVAWIGTQVRGPDDGNSYEGVHRFRFFAQSL